MELSITASESESVDGGKKLTFWNDEIPEINVEECDDWYNREDNGSLEHKMIASSPQKPDMRSDGSEEVMLFSFAPSFPTHNLVF